MNEDMLNVIGSFISTELDAFENLHKELEEKGKEIERLNNIINKFNKLIENEINESKLEEDYDRVNVMEYCLATLRELKGSDSND